MKQERGGDKAEDMTERRFEGAGGDETSNLFCFFVFRTVLVWFDVGAARGMAMTMNGRLRSAHLVLMGCSRPRCDGQLLR